jgi:NADPH:quinone reductase-like Zn-dependent oxidoreductase
VYGELTGYGRSGWGGFAEYVCAPERALVLKPARMTFAQAAALPQAGQLAVQGLFANPLLNERFEAGQLVPVIDGPYTLSEGAEALRHFGAGNHLGKVVITVAP